MKIVILILVTLMLSWGYSEAQLNQEPNLLGLYFDEQAEENCIEGVTPYQIVQMHAILTNPGMDEIAGFEFGMDMVGSAIILQTTVPGNHFWDPIEYVLYVVGFGSPQPLGPINILVSFSLLYTDTSGAHVAFYLREADVPSGPWDQPGVWLPGGEFVPLVINYSIGEMSASINEVCALPAQPRTLESVKALFR